jgi:hypothetical protein
MTPKEKAEELFIKFYPNWYDNGLVAKRKYAKEHALIAVDEILKTFDCTTPQQVNYWQEVKAEIENL